MIIYLDLLMQQSMTSNTVVLRYHGYDHILKSLNQELMTVFEGHDPRVKDPKRAMLEEEQAIIWCPKPTASG